MVLKISTIEDCKIINLPKIHNRPGNITPIHSNIEIPFDIKRVYYLYDIPGGESYGEHAHKGLYQLEIYQINDKRSLGINSFNQN
jgi:hypothetical protein